MTECRGRAEMDAYRICEDGGTISSDLREFARL